MAKDYYQTLGISKNATEAEIKKAFRTLAHEHHPDKKGGSEQKFKELNEAYQVLGNAEKRKRYDQFGADFDQPGGSGSYSWNGAGNPFAGFEGFGQQNASFDFGDLGDILGGMFGFEQPSQHGSRVRKGSDIETTVSISFDESYFGTEKEIEIPTHLSCEHCSGSGNEPGTKISNCATCKGSGRISAVRNTMIGAMRTETICTACQGSGKIAEKKCTICKGSTILRKNQKIKFAIPAGIDDGRAIRLTGKGEAGAHNGPQGDLYIKMRVNVHPHFKREGYDIQSIERIPFSILVAGGSVQIPTPSGEVKLKIPQGTESGKVFVLKDKGFERLSGRGRGNLLVTIEAYVPKNISQDQKKLLDQLGETFSSKDQKKRWW